MQSRSGLGDKRMVNVIFFIHEDAGMAGKRLQKVIRNSLAKCRRQVCPTISELADRLRCPVPYGEQELYVLLADNRDRLNEMVRLKNLLEGKWMVLIIAEQSDASLANAHLLCPRFFTTVGAGFDDVIAVLNKRIGTVGARRNGSLDQGGYVPEQNAGNRGSQ